VPKSLNPALLAVHARALAQLGKLAEPGRLKVAVDVGLERAINLALSSACEEEGVATDQYLAALGEEPELQQAVEAAVERILEHPDIPALQRRARLRGVERNLYLLRLSLCAQRPPSWVTETMDPEVLEELEAGADAEDPGGQALLERVRAALEKLPDPERFGRCEGCEGTIRMDRLELIPYAERCTPCQRTYEGDMAAEPDLGPAVAVLHF
jgi:RNA polymerase-binding transcription factor DksA